MLTFDGGSGPAVAVMPPPPALKPLVVCKKEFSGMGAISRTAF